MYIHGHIQRVTVYGCVSRQLQALLSELTKAIDIGHNQLYYYLLAKLEPWKWQIFSTDYINSVNFAIYFSGVMKFRCIVKLPPTLSIIVSYSNRNRTMFYGKEIKSLNKYPSRDLRSRYGEIVFCLCTSNLRAITIRFCWLTVPHI